MLWRITGMGDVRRMALAAAAKAVILKQRHGGTQALAMFYKIEKVQQQKAAAWRVAVCGKVK